MKNLGLVLFYATHSRQPQCWVNLQTLPLQVLEATDIGNRRIAAATQSHTLTSLGRFLRRKSVGHAGLNGKWLCDSPLTFVPFAGVPANMRHWRPLLQTLSVKRLAFSLEEVIKERPVKKMLPAELKCKISTVVLMKWVSI